MGIDSWSLLAFGGGKSRSSQDLPEEKGESRQTSWAISKLPGGFCCEQPAVAGCFIYPGRRLGYYWQEEDWRSVGVQRSGTEAEWQSSDSLCPLGQVLWRLVRLKSWPGFNALLRRFFRIRGAYKQCRRLCARLSLVQFLRFPVFTQGGTTFGAVECSIERPCTNTQERTPPYFREAGNNKKYQNPI